VGLIATGSYFTYSAYSKVKFYPDIGVVLNAICTECEGLYCIQHIILNISYEINGTYHIGTYEALEVPNCEPEPVYNASAECCRNIIGDELYLNINKKDEITDISDKNYYNSSLYVSLAVVFYILSCLSCCICGIVAKCKNDTCHQRLFRHDYQEID